MMPSLLGVNLPAMPSMGYLSDAALDELSRQLAASPRRFSRGSSTQRPTHAMRITKPSSTSNSPRSSIQVRRRTLMNDDAFARRNPQVEPPSLPTPAPEVSYEEPQKTRPVSWHPSSHLAPSAGNTSSQRQTQYPFPVWSECEPFPTLQQFPPTPAEYSGYTSPVSTFSPVSLPYSAFDNAQYAPATSWSTSAQSPTVGLRTVPTIPSPAALSEKAPVVSVAVSVTVSQDSSAQWNAFVVNGFSSCSTPPTPENLPPQQAEPMVSTEESIPYQPLEEDEDDGEILYGMGLYDTPEKNFTDPQLSTFRSAVSSLLGNTYCYPEPTGKGLKLEDAWEPPEKIDDDDDEEDQEDGGDAEGEDSDS